MNRLDEIIMFDNLGANAIKRIVDIQLDRLAGRLADKRVTLSLTDGAKEHLAQAGFDPLFGARPLKRAIQTEVLNPLAVRMLSGDVQPDSHVEADVRDGRIDFG